MREREGERAQSVGRVGRGWKNLTETGWILRAEARDLRWDRRGGAVTAEPRVSVLPYTPNRYCVLAVIRFLFFLFFFSSLSACLVLSVDLSEPESKWLVSRPSETMVVGLEVNVRRREYIFFFYFFFEILPLREEDTHFFILNKNARRRDKPARGRRRSFQEAAGYKYTTQNGPWLDQRTSRERTPRV